MARSSNSKVRFRWSTSPPRRLISVARAANRSVSWPRRWAIPVSLDTDPGAALAYAYDIVCNGNEIGGGSIRIHRRDIQEKVFAIMGISHDEAQEKFGFLLDAFAYGAPPHGGIAFGWDRITALLAGENSIREVIAFPKSGGGVDPLTDAPAAITAQQRKESGIDAKPAVRADQQATAAE